MSLASLGLRVGCLLILGMAACGLTQKKGVTSVGLAVAEESATIPSPSNPEAAPPEQVAKDLESTIGKLDGMRNQYQVENAKAYRNLLCSSLTAQGSGGGAVQESRITITLNRPPPVRVMVSFDREDGTHTEVEFDPNQTLPLTRVIALDLCRDWRVSFVADPLYLRSPESNSSAARYLTYQFNAPQCLLSASSTLTTQLIAQHNKIDQAIKDRSVQLDSLLAKLTEACEKAKDSLICQRLQDKQAAVEKSKLDATALQTKLTSRAVEVNNLTVSPDTCLGSSPTSAELTDVLNPADPNAPAPGNGGPPLPAPAKVSKGLDFTITLGKQPKPSLRDAIGDLSVTDPGAGGSRSALSTLNSVAADVGQLLAEIAFDRAKRKAFALLSDRFRRFVCTDLRIDVGKLPEAKYLFTEAEIANPARDEDAAEIKSRILVQLIEPNLIGYRGPRLLPRTCEVAKNIRIQELSASGKQIYESLILDMYHRTLALLRNRVQQIELAGRSGVSTEASSLATKRRALINELTQETLEQLVPLLGKVVQGKPLTQRDVQMVLLKLGRSTVTSLSKHSGDQEQCQYLRPLSLAFAVMSQCQRAGRCDAGIIDTMLERPQDYFALSDCGSTDQTELPWPELRHFVSHGLEILSPPRGTTPEGQLRLVVNMIFDVADYLLKNPPAARASYEDAEWCHTGPVGLRDSMNEIRAILLSALDRDVPRALLSAATLLQRHAFPCPSTTSNAKKLNRELDEINKQISSAQALIKRLTKQHSTAKGAQTPDLESIAALTEEILANEKKYSRLLAQIPLKEKEIAKEGARDPDNRDRTRMEAFLSRMIKMASAMTAYAQNYSLDGGGDPKQVQAQREARKKALESLIDLATDRSERYGEFIVSVGTNASIMPVGYQHDFNQPLPDNRHSTSFMQISLPTGLALQWMNERGGQLGGHLQFSVLDLAQFLSYNDKAQMTEVNWANFFTIGVQAGMLLGGSRRPRPADLFFLGCDFRYAPSLSFIPEGERGSWNASPRGVFRMGLLLGYYVPFFDFN